MSDAVLQFLIANLALSGGILLVFVLRKTVRAQFGARLGYALWLLPLLAAMASFIPPRVVETIVPAVAPVFEPMPAPVEPAVALPAAPVVAVPAGPVVTVDPWAVGGLVWIMGMVAMAAWLAAVQMRFMAGVRRGEAGPAVVGFLRPRIVTPADFEMRYDPGERRVIIAHETIHLDRNDARINALAALIRCVCWFNPLVHVAAHFLRIDQEMACDAAVVERHPKARKLYADALLKTQLAAHPLPLGCYWPPGTEHPLMERIEMLKRSAPGLMRRSIGIALVGVLAVGGSFAAWAARPPQERVVFEAPQQTPAPAPKGLGATIFNPRFAGRFSQDDLGKMVFLLGTVERMERTGPDVMVSIKAQKIMRMGDGVETENSQTWRALLPGKAMQPFFNDGSAVGKPIRVQGIPEKGADCAVTCLLGAAGSNIIVGQSGPPRLFDYDRYDPAKMGPAPERPNDAPKPVAGPGFDQKSYVVVRGRIVRVQPGDPTATVWIQAREINRNYGAAEPNNDTWRVDQPRVSVDNPLFHNRADFKVGTDIRVDGYVSTNCRPECRIQPLLVDLNPNATYSDSIEPVVYDGPAPGPQQLQPAASVPIDIRADRVVTGPEAMSFGGNVEVRYDGRIITSDILDVVAQDGKRRTLVFRKNVRVRRGGELLTAEQFPLVIPDTALLTSITRFPPEQFAPQHFTSQPASAAAAAPDGFDANDPIHLLGKVEKIEFRDTTYVAFVRAASIAACPQGPEKANTALWELSPTPYWGDRDAVMKDLMNASVYVRGFNARDKSCAQNCRMLARGVFKGMGSNGAFSDPALACSRAPQPTRYEPQPVPQAPLAAPAVHGEPSLLEIRADRGRYDEPSRTAIYEGDVEIRFDGGLFKTDRLVVEDGAAPARASSLVLLPRVSIGAPSPIKVNSDRSDRDPLSGTVVYSGNVELRGADVLLKADRLTLALAKALTPISAPEPQKPQAPEPPTKKPGAEVGDAAKDPSKRRTEEEEIIEKKKSEVEDADLKRQALKSKAEVEQAELKRQAMKSKAEEALRGGKAELRKIETPKDRELMDKLRSSGEIDKLRKAEAIEKLRKAEETGKLRKEDAADDRTLVPKGAEPKPAPTSFEPPPAPPLAPPGPSIPFAKYFDADAPVMLKGRVTAIDVFEGHAMLRVEEIQTTTPGVFSFPKPDVTKMWRVVLGRLDAAPAWARDPTLVGKVVEIRGYRGKEKDCGNDCMMSGRDVILSGERLQGWAVPERPKPPPPQLKPI